MVEKEDFSGWKEEQFRQLGFAFTQSTDRERFLRTFLKAIDKEANINLTHRALRAISLLHKLQLYLPETSKVFMEFKSIANKISERWRAIKTQKI